MILVCSLLISILIGFLFILPFLKPRDEPIFESILYEICLAAGVGCGITSCIYFLWLAIYGRTGYGFLAIEFILLAVLSGLNLYLKKKTGFRIVTGNPDCIAAGSCAANMLLVMLCCLLVSSGIIFLKISSILWHGGWDAWQTWNLLARFMYRGGENWSAAINNLSASHHPDYPLLVPASVARLWQYAGGETQIAPICIAGMFMFASAGMIFSAVSLINGRNAGYLASIILLGTSNYIVLGTYQYADIPLAFYYLAALSLILLQDLTPYKPVMSFLAGTLAGFACWTKNEGLLFLLAVISASLMQIFIFKEKKAALLRLCYLLAGAGMVMTVFFYFKFEIAPDVNLFMKQSSKMVLEKIWDFSRLAAILKAFFKINLNTNPLFFLVALLPFYSRTSINRKMTKGVFVILMVMLMMYTGYLAFYVITPYNLEWHLETSLSRLLMQLWPSFILAVFSLPGVPLTERLAGIAANKQLSVE